MFIFIDEAGTFQVPKRRNLVSCVAALVVPEPFATTLFRRFRKLTRPWRRGRKEIKGSELNEDQVAAVIALARRFDVLLLAGCIDLGLHTEDAIAVHKEGQASAFLKSIDERTHPHMKSDLETLAARFRKLSNQLYAQAVVLTEVVSEVVHASTLYYAQRIPKTLGSFKWRVDAKDHTITNAEDLWQTVAAAFLQTMSLLRPIAQMREADYSAFERFYFEADEIPPHLKGHLPDSGTSLEGKPFEALDVKKILTEDLKFARSERYSGLQLADVLATSLRRACNGTLQRRGWRDLGRLMVQREKGLGNVVRLIALQKFNPSKQRLPYNDVVKQFDRDCKRMVTRG